MQATKRASGTEAGERARTSGVRAGLIVFIGIAAANVGNYLFQLIAARWLGPVQYGDLAALVALAAIVTLPLGGLQAAVARDVAALAAGRRLELAAARIKHALVLALEIGLAAALVLMLLSPLLRRVLAVESLSAVAMTLALVLPALLVPLLIGWLQGGQRFGMLSITLAAGPAVRILLLGLAIATGAGVAGAAGATLIATAVTVAIPVVLLYRGAGRGVARSLGRVDWRKGVTRSAPVMVGLLALTALSTVDVVVANAMLAEHEAGIYASASLIARVILYLSTAVATVLLPKVSERFALKQDTRAILGASLLVTGTLSGAATIVYALLSNALVTVTVGSAYADAAPLLWLFALTMSGYSLLNVLLFGDLGHGGTRMTKLLVAGALAQALGYGLFHGSPWQLLTVNAVTALMLLAVHEAMIDPSLTRAIRTCRSTIGSVSSRREP